MLSRQGGYPVAWKRGLAALPWYRLHNPSVPLVLPATESAVATGKAGS